MNRRGEKIPKMIGELREGYETNSHAEKLWR